MNVPAINDLQQMDTSMQNSIVVFDSGVGSYAIVEKIQKKYPFQNIYYLADRKSFPYGNKSREELFINIRNAIRFSENYNPMAIVLASNAPSIILKNDFSSMSLTPVYGVLPPVKDALSKSKCRSIALLGVRSLIESQEIKEYIKENSLSGDHVHLINASPLIELVENGEFLKNKNGTEEKVYDFMLRLKNNHPKIDVCTLSSTHLPWLHKLFEKCAPDCLFVDPANTIIANLPLKLREGKGVVRGLVTENELHPCLELEEMFTLLGVKIPLEVISIPESR